MGKKLTIEFVRKKFEERGYILLETEYINSGTPMSFRCINHPNEDLKISYSHLREGQGCKFCGYEKKESKFIYDINDIIEINSGKIIIIDRYKKLSKSNVSKKYYKYECLICGHIEEKIENSIKIGKLCMFCNKHNIQNIRACVNNIHKTNPKLEFLMLNKNNAYLYTQNSHAKIDWICEFCGNIIYDKQIKCVNKYGLFCNICGKNGYFPERLINNILIELNLKIKMQKTFEWCVFKINDKKHKGRYDFVFEFNNKKYIIEADGGFHNRVRPDEKLTLKDIILIDSEKDRLAKENGYEIIRIDCDPSEFNFIKNNILHSELNNLFDLSNINWQKCHENSIKNLVKESWDLWDCGMSIKKISNKLNIHVCTVRRYLKLGNEIDKCTYQSYKQLSLRTSKKIVCLNTKEIFESIIMASKIYSINASNISQCCLGNYKSAGKHPQTNERMIWLYYDEKEHKNFTIIK